MAVPTPESAHSSSETPTHTPQQLFGTFRSNLKHRAPLSPPDPPTIQNTDLLLVAIALVLSSGSELWALALVWALALGSGSVLWLCALALGSGSGLWLWALALGSGSGFWLTLALTRRGRRIAAKGDNSTHKMWTPLARNGRPCSFEASPRLPPLGGSREGPWPNLKNQRNQKTNNGDCE